MAIRGRETRRFRASKAGATDREGGPPTEEQIVAHMCFVAAEIPRLVCQVGGINVIGRIEPPDFDRMAIAFAPAAPLEPEATPAPGANLKLLYAHGEDKFAFQTALTHVDASGRFWMGMPTVVHRQRQRLAARHRVVGKWTLRARNISRKAGEQVLDIHDVSTGGLAVVFDPNRHDLAQGTIFSAVLNMPDGGRIALRAEVRNVRPHPKERKKLLAGCVFKGFGFANHQTLAQALKDQEARIAAIKAQ